MTRPVPDSTESRSTAWPDPADVTACTCANLRKASRVVTQVYDAALQPTGLNSGQFTLLATLSKCGDTPVTRLAEAMVLDRTTLTRNLKPLEREGLVAIYSELDQRVRVVSLTDAGRAALTAARPHWQRAQSQLTTALGAERWAAFLTDLTATVEAVREP